MGVSPHLGFFSKLGGWWFSWGGFFAGDGGKWGVFSKKKYPKMAVFRPTNPKYGI